MFGRFHLFYRISMSIDTYQDIIAAGEGELAVRVTNDVLSLTGEYSLEWIV